ncbi:hypothetical protein DA2_3801 [Desulfovibrio sp. A2]|nr:hypothetical protein DA2_3801 [Desulfovibrio sp. A2]
MPSRVTIMNRALRRVNAPQIASPDESSASARQCSMAWGDTLEGVLADHEWSHAVRWMTLAKLATPPPFGFRWAYRLPTECQRLIDVRATPDLRLPAARHELVGREVYTDASPCLARVVVLHDTPEEWPSHFCTAFVVRLASEIAPTLAQSADMGIKLYREYLQVLDTSRLTDVSQSNPEPEDEAGACDFLKARRK